MRQSGPKHNIDGLIALVLFGVFAACILSVLLTGANAYKNLTELDRESFARRTCVQYIATKVRQAESGESVYVVDFGGTDALCIEENIGSRTYITRIYCYDGWLREIFTSSSTESIPNDGEKILEAESADFSIDSGLLKVSLTDGEGSSSELSLSLRGEGAGR